MEGLTRIVSESLARHGFDRPLDYRRLSWSRWFRCESHHSLLFVPSKPGVFALAEEITDMGSTIAHVGTDAFVRPASEASAPVRDRVSDPVRPSEARLRKDLAGTTATPPTRRMLAVTQFFEDDDMAFVLDRMLSRQNPMSSRLASGRYFARYVVIEDQTQRRSICSALNQWMVSAAEKASGIGSHFATSLELTPATEYVSPENDAQPPLFAGATNIHVATGAGPTLSGVEGAVPRSEASAPRSEPGSASASSPTAPHLNSGAATNIHCPSPLPSGF
jgi:hypothetical protein